jgi:hypothetical protein
MRKETGEDKGVEGEDGAESDTDSGKGEDATVDKQREC